VFGRRRREEAEALVLAARDRLQVNAEQTAVLVETVSALKATISAEIERTRRLEARADATAVARSDALAAQAAGVSAALERVASMYARLAEHLEADRLERPALTEALGHLGRRLAPPDAARPRVLGGSVFATPEVDAPVDPREIILAEEAVRVVPSAPPFDLGTAVCCRFGDQWIDGVEIVEVVDDSPHPSYRLRRRQDGYVIPALFCARDLRAAHQPSADIGG
jgi:hypothetical protein